MNRTLLRVIPEQGVESDAISRLFAAHEGVAVFACRGQSDVLLQVETPDSFPLDRFIVERVLTVRDASGKRMVRAVEIESPQPCLPTAGV